MPAKGSWNRCEAVNSSIVRCRSWNIMVQGADFRVSRLYETRKPKTIHVVAQVADVLQQQSLHVRSRIGDSFC
uniref:Mob-like protein n=1 Tax=Burkholderia cenocepacia TaxID=95486 RepID=B8R6A8_9BURK|nr:mob-like protein [Burkholderia cenocepacia]